MTGARAIATIALNELRRLGRDRVALVLTLGLPVVIIVVIGSTFGAASDAVSVGVVDQDGSAQAAALVTALERTDGIDVERPGSLDELRRDVRIGSLGAGVVIPRGYGRAIDAGRSIDVDLVVDPTSNQAVAVRTTVEAAVAGESTRLAAARVAIGHGDVDEADALATADRLAGELPRTRVRTETVGGDGDDEDVNAFSYTAASNLVLFVFISTLSVGAVLATDRQQGMTSRMLSTPQRTATILAGIGAAKLLFALVQSAAILVMGALLFGVSWGDPVGAALVVALFAVVATAVGLLVGASASDADQAQSIGVPVAIALGMLGGCMWPLEIVPPVMRAVGHAVPQAWAMDAWIGLVFDGESVADILPELAALAVFAAGLGTLATWRLRVALTR